MFYNGWMLQAIYKAPQPQTASPSSFAGIQAAQNIRFGTEPLSPPANAKAYYPASPNGLVLKLAQWINAVVLKHRKLEVSVAPEALAALKFLPADAGVIIAPNHNSALDRYVMLEVSRQAGRGAQSMGALDAFQYNTPIKRWILQQLGVFSVSGKPGDAGKAYAEALVSQGPDPLVIFPEGAETYKGSELQPFKYGAASIALKAAANRPVWIFPMALKYRYDESLEPRLGTALHELEAKAALSERPDFSTLQRIRRLLSFAQLKATRKELQNNEGIANVVSRLQLAILKQWPPTMQRAVRKVEVTLGEPIDARRYLPMARVDRSLAVQNLTRRMSTDISRLLLT